MSTTLYVQFSDSSETAIITYFGGPQPDGAYSNYGSLDTSDARWKAFYDAMSGAGYGEGLPPPN